MITKGKNKKGKPQHGSNSPRPPKASGPYLEFSYEKCHSKPDERLLEAAWTNDIDRLKEAIFDGADVDAVTDAGSTALMLTAMRGHLEITNVLMKRMADVDAKDSNDKTALMFAAEFDRKEIVMLLLQNDADVDAKDALGRTASMYAAKYGHLETMKVLLLGGADTTLLDKDGKSASDYALENGHEKVAYLLKPKSD